MTFTVFMTKALAFLMSIFLTLVPYTGFSAPNFKAKEDDIQLNIAMISDVHISPYDVARKVFLSSTLTNLKRASTKVDVLLTAGDITNYADTESLVDFYEILAKYATFPTVTVAGNHDIGHAGDRNVVDYSREEALQYFIDYHNLYTGDNITTNYWTQEVNGYKFIVIGDEVIDGGKWDGISMTKEQIEWLDRELASAEGKPVFVCCHWPADDINGEDIIWEGSGINFEKNPIKEILEKYQNVFYISGHMHGGVRCTVVGDMFNMKMAEQVNGVTYINLPTFGIVNQYGLPISGTGAQLEVYSDKVIFRPVNYLTGRWYSNSNYTFDLVTVD